MHKEKYKLDIFGKKAQQENQELKEQIEVLKKEQKNLEAMLTPEMKDAATLSDKIRELNLEKTNIEKNIQKLYTSELQLSQKIASLNEQLIVAEDSVEMESFALYTPRFDYVKAETYKDHLTFIRNKQKSMIKKDTAVFGNLNWTVNNSLSKGKKMVNDMKKLCLRSFNNECDVAVNSVKFNNFDRCVNRINKSAEAINKLGQMMSVYISDEYIQLKIDELSLALEYQTKKQEEKEALRELKAQQREEAKLAKEIQEARKEIEKERQHYLKALKDIEKRFNETDNDEDKALLKEKMQELGSHLDDVNTKMEDIDYREANQRAGYVYIISNIGAFGKDIYKIGMTRRLVPQDRIDELSGASVPFNFDIHALIFSDDAPKLEHSLHEAFADRKLNVVNTRREFFNVSLDEIKKVVKENYDKIVEFVDIPPAEQYRESLKIKQSKTGEL
ncbi:MAG: DUF4041 domain-containing protein [Firmicutes bacterium]|nr:DUF4041 domain-containing protein [Bacillota bacterium]